MLQDHLTQYHKSAYTTASTYVSEDAHVIRQLTGNNDLSRTVLSSEFSVEDSQWRSIPDGRWLGFQALAAATGNVRLLAPSDERRVITVSMQLRYNSGVIRIQEKRFI